MNLQRKAIRAYPTPNLPAVAPLDPKAPDAAIEGARFARETAHRQERIDAVTDHRNEQVKRLFIKAMPGWLRSKLMEQTTATPIDDLCNLSRRQITIRELCRKDDYPEDGFNEINESVSENLINALSKITTVQQALEKRFTNLDRRLESQSRDHQTVAAVQESATRNVNAKFQNQQTAQTSGNLQTNYRGNFRRNFRANYRSDNTQRGGYNNQNYQSFYSSNYGPNRFQNQQPRFRSQWPGNNYNRPNRFPYWNYNQQPNRLQQRYHNPATQIPNSHTTQLMMHGTDIQTPTGPYMPVVRATTTFCEVCGYPNHKASQCAANNRKTERNQYFPYNNQKN